MTAPGAPPNADLIYREWEKVVDVQSGFNTLIITARTLGVSVVMTLYGAAAFTLASFPALFFPLWGGSVHAAVFIVLFALLLVVDLLVIDLLYYYRLLLGSVDRTSEIDVYVRSFDPHLLGLTTYISNRANFRKQTSQSNRHVVTTMVVLSFYGIMIAAGVLFAVYLFSLTPPAGGS